MTDQFAMSQSPHIFINSCQRFSFSFIKVKIILVSARWKRVMNQRKRAAENGKKKII